MHVFDWLVLAFFFSLLAGIGLYTTLFVRKSEDYFVGGGKLPWWVAGISHHVGGYSAVAFTAWAMYAYRDGLSIYFWWGVLLSCGCLIGAFVFAPRWSRMRRLFGVQSPVEFLAVRYGAATELVISCGGVMLKLFDLAGKTLATAYVLNGFTELPLACGIFLAAGVGMLYNTFGGFMASTRTDVFQFLVLFFGGVVIFLHVLAALQEHDLNYVTMWEKLGPDKLRITSEQCNAFYFFGFFWAGLLGFNGGNWGLGMRYLAAPNGRAAFQSAVLSGILYLIWPLILLAPMWSAPLFFPGLNDQEATGTYMLMAKRFLPPGMIGAVLAAIFAASITTIVADTNAASAVLSRDIAPRLSRRLKRVMVVKGQTPLLLARILTLLYASTTILLAFHADLFGGIIGLVVKWFSGLIGPLSVPVVFGMLYSFRRCGSCGAILSVFGGAAAFAANEYAYGLLWGTASPPLSMSLFLPITSSLLIFSLFAFLNPREPAPQVLDLLDQLAKEPS